MHVAPVLTEDAQRFVGALTFSALASEPARTSLFDGPEPIPHTRLGQSADLVVVAPATAKLLGKYAAGISDDLLTATLLATRAPVLVCPAMHTEMWEHPAVQENLATLRRRGVHVRRARSRAASPAATSGAGRLADPERDRRAAAARVLGARPATSPASACSSPRAAPASRSTRCAIIGNRSSGKMGYAIAEAARPARRRASRSSPPSAGPSPPGVEVVRGRDRGGDARRGARARADDADVDRDGRRGRRLPAQGSRRPTS